MIKGKTNVIRIGPRQDIEVIFEVSVVAIVSEINSRINLAVGNSLVSGHVCFPLRRIVTEQIIPKTRQLLQTVQSCAGICAVQLQPELSIVQSKNCFA